MLNPTNLRKFQNVVEKESNLKEVLTELYPTYIASYFRFRKKIGPHCAFCRAAARFMFFSEVKRNSPDFVRRFENNDWENYS
jgi:hypothetical protein